MASIALLGGPARGGEPGPAPEPPGAEARHEPPNQETVSAEPDEPGPPEAPLAPPPEETPAAAEAQPSPEPLVPDEPSPDRPTGTTDLTRPPSVETLRVAVGLAPEAPGTRQELADLDRLEASMRASTNPRAQVRRLRAGAATSSTVCLEGRDDLVLRMGYLGEHPGRVVLAQDCQLARPLPARDGAAVADSELLAVLWGDHHELLRQGAQPRTRRRLSPRARTILIAGGAAVALGVALGILAAYALRDETVVFKVSP